MIPNHKRCMNCNILDDTRKMVLHIITHQIFYQALQHSSAEWLGVLQAGGQQILEQLTLCHGPAINRENE